MSIGEFYYNITKVLSIFLWYTEKAIPVPVGCIKLHKKKKVPSNKYQSKNDQYCVFGSVVLYFAEINCSGTEANPFFIYYRVYLIKRA